MVVTPPTTSKPPQFVFCPLLTGEKQPFLETHLRQGRGVSTLEKYLQSLGQGTTIETIMRYIYMLRVGTDNYKIGIARSVKKRVLSIQTSNSKLVEVVTTRLVKEPESAERKIHNLLKEYRMPGGKEWFKLSPNQALQTAIDINKFDEADIADSIVNNIRKDVHRSIFNYEKIQTEIINKARIKNDILKDEDISKAARYQEFDELVKAAIEVFRDNGKASTSLLQRKMNIGYAKAARIMDELERLEMIGEQNGSKPREINV